MAFLAVNGRNLILKADSSSVYREVLAVVDDTPLNGNEIQGPIAAGTPVTLPNSGTYSGDELVITLNGIDLIPLLHYTYVGTGTRTQVSFTSKLEGTRALPDQIEFFKNEA